MFIQQTVTSTYILTNTPNPDTSRFACIGLSMIMFSVIVIILIDRQCHIIAEYNILRERYCAVGVIEHILWKHKYLHYRDGQTPTPQFRQNFRKFEANRVKPIPVLQFSKQFSVSGPQALIYTYISNIHCYNFNRISVYTTRIRHISIVGCYRKGILQCGMIYRNYHQAPSLCLPEHVFLMKGLVKATSMFFVN